MVAEHYARDFDMIFHFKAAQNLVVERYEIDFDMIFHIKAAQNLVAEHYERFFDMIFHINAAQILVADHYESRRVFRNLSRGGGALLKIFFEGCQKVDFHIFNVQVYYRMLLAYSVFIIPMNILGGYTHVHDCKLIWWYILSNFPYVEWEN